MRQAVAELTVDRLLDNILYYRVHDFAEQLALCNVLPSYLAAARYRRRAYLHPYVPLAVPLVPWASLLLYGWRPLVYLTAAR